MSEQNNHEEEKMNTEAKADTAENTKPETETKQETGVRQEPETKTENKVKSSEKDGGMQRLLIGVVAILVVLVFCLSVALVSSKKKNSGKDDKKGTQTDAAQEVSESTAGDVAEVTEASETEEKTEAAKTDVSGNVTVQAVNSWVTDDRYYTQYSISIFNDSSEDYDSWTLKLTIPDDTLMSDIWNGTGVIDGDTLTVTAADYNSRVPAGEGISDIGFILSSFNRDGLAAVCDSTSLYVSGELVVAGAAKPDADKPENTPTTEEASTEAVESMTPSKKEEGTPFANHGKLSVNGTDLVDANGDKYQLKGLSTHGIAWFPDYVNKDAFATFRDDWDANLIRLAMYTDENGGYCKDGNKQQLKDLVDKGVQAATELGMYVIVDWHILHDLSPKVYQDEAKKFFAEMSAKYKEYDNVIYEICNEPNGGTTWTDVKSYAEVIIPIIRENAPEAIIIVGTPTWSQDVDIAAENPITGYDNIMYAVHFYAATHTEWIRNKTTTAINAGIPVFISEFSICDASGNGAIDYNQADLWFDLIADYNLSYAAWNISNKAETSSVIKSSCNKTSGWTTDDLSDTGKWIRSQMRGE